MNNRKIEKMDSFVCFVEYLTGISWFLYIMPWVLYQRIAKKQKILRVYFFERSKVTYFLICVVAKVMSLPVEQLQFRFYDIRDDFGVPLWSKMASEHLANIQQQILEEPIFKEALGVEAGNQIMQTHFTKKVASSWRERDTSNLWRTVSLMQVLNWKLKQYSNLSRAKKVLFLDQRIWFQALKRYASNFNIGLIPVKRIKVDLRRLIISFFGSVGIRWLRNIFGLISSSMIKTKGPRKSNNKSERKGPHLAVEYYGQLNLDHPELYSDLFFWQNSALSGEDIILTFHLPTDPLDEQKYNEIRRHDMDAVILDSRARQTSLASLFCHKPKNIKKAIKINSKTIEAKWLQKEMHNYYAERSYWVDFFTQYSVKAHITWCKYDTHHCPRSDALRAIGGVSTIYQRSFEELPSVETTIAADVVFGFSQKNSMLERKSKSIIPYHVAVGYIGDHRIPLVQKHSNDLRRKLQKSGAKQIISFFDENSQDDVRWSAGHVFTQNNYAFLLEKVLSLPWLGLIIKPKVFSTLKRRLGPDITALLEEAEKTGRCCILGTGALHNSYPPVMTALASDLVIHGHLCAATAGLESALTGTPTLLIDLEKCPASVLYNLGKGKVVFDNWQQLWECYIEHINKSDSGGVPGFGDWSSMLDEIDPFRDGRAAQRIGTYLKWILDGFRTGLKRETVLADAAVRYAEIWGQDKISEVKGELVCPR